MTAETQSLVSKGTFLLPESASTLSSNVDSLFYFLFWGSVVIFVGMLLVGIWFAYKYKRTPQNQEASEQMIHNTALEVSWTVIPLIIVMIIFAWGYKDYLRLTVVPPYAKEIRVTGKKWLWEFEYAKEGVKLLNEIVVPVNTPVRLVMTSEDVIHSFFVPNFRIKRDVLPNRYTRIWFEATEVGDYQVFCTEYCGDGHSNMLATLKVVSESEYTEWLAAGNSNDDLPLDELGKKLYTSKACNTCHSTDGSSMTGPTWKGLYNSNRTMADGSTAKADDNYLRESIVNPAAKIVAGYPPVMPTYAGLLSDREIAGLIEFIKGVK